MPLQSCNNTRDRSLPSTEELPYSILLWFSFQWITQLREMINATRLSMSIFHKSWKIKQFLSSAELRVKLLCILLGHKCLVDSNFILSFSVHLFEIGSLHLFKTLQNLKNGKLHKSRLSLFRIQLFLPFLSVQYEFANISVTWLDKWHNRSLLFQSNW